LESLNIKIDSLSSTPKNQLNFNKMIETQLAQLAALVPSAKDGKIPWQPISSCEDVCVLSTRWGKPSRRTQPTDYAGYLSVGIISNCTQERSRLSGYHLHDALLENQECSL
jgi:hypothetical protein